MSALAQYLNFKGYFVTGSDKISSETIKRLKSDGICVFIGHSEQNVAGADVVIYSSAISNDNPELQFAIDNKLPCVKRSALLKIISNSFCNRIGVCGSHGKTTVTSMLAHVFNRAKLSFTAHIGGCDNDFGNLIIKGDGVFLSEVCEFKHSIDDFTAETAICLNVDNDHLNCYDGFDDLKNTFYDYLNRAKLRIINGDDRSLKDYKNKAVLFGLKKGDYRIEKYKTYPDGGASFKVVGKLDYPIEFELPYCAEYYAMNVLAAVSASHCIGIKEQFIFEGINEFKGVKRRNEVIGNLNGIPVIADYAHHPTEIESFLSARRNEQVICVFQPHTYSRTKILFDDFISVLSGVKKLYLYKTYSAREEFDYSGSCEKLKESLVNAIYYEDFNELFSAVKKESLNCDKDSEILVIGAGDLYDKFKEKLSSEN